ncbi:hypothetical protein F8M41_018656 [Gigaspora margarita]|uniref:Uncharacterized protein n=1 Tax=Gigaspora margarita TaxID=4874 RepID=A0A8H4AL78_GIGMA|nr:hypothetical protein F8M41_018656 [Gigaspora margarita]
MSPDPLVSQQNVIFTVSGTWKDNGLIKAHLDDEHQIRIDNFANPATPTKAVKVKIFIRLNVQISYSRV